MILVPEIRQISKIYQELKLEFMSDGVDFYSFKIDGRLAMPQERRRSKLSTFSFLYIHTTNDKLII